MLAKSTSPEIRAAIAAGPPRMNIGSICKPCALKKPRANATRTGISLFHDRLTKTTRSNFFSCAAMFDDKSKSIRHAINHPRRKNSTRKVFIGYLRTTDIRVPKLTDQLAAEKSIVMSATQSLFVDRLNERTIQ